MFSLSLLASALAQTLLERAVVALAARLPSDRIPGDNGDPFLDKYTVFRKGAWALRLHHFHRADIDLELHNHPWRIGVSLILVGGYEEERWRFARERERLTYPPGAFNVLFDSTFHRVSKLLGPDCWTLFLTGPQTQSWGFLNEETSTLYRWRDFLTLKHAQNSLRSPPRPAKD